MHPEAIAVVAVGFLLFGVFSQAARGSFLTGPLLFAAFGLLAGPSGLGWVRLSMAEGFLHTLAEATLILVLFADAATVDLKVLRRDHKLPTRLLLVGMPLTILFTAGAAALFFPGLSLWEAALVGVLLAPTDAALGQAVVTSSAVPLRIRTALSVESGLNDGIALPLVLIFASLAFPPMAGGGGQSWGTFAAAQVTLGPLAGALVGYLGARAVDRASANGWMAAQAEGIVALALAFLAFAFAELIHGNGFIAAFVAGLIFGNTLRKRCEFLYEFAEAEGLILILTTFFVFGSSMLPQALGHVTLVVVAFGLLCLTVLRMVPVGLALLGTGVGFKKGAFLGWFGPRGLATILFVLLIVEELEMAGRESIVTAAVTTVALSILLHGITSGPLSRRFGASETGPAS
ncbi:MAG: cation:proton antiporter [Longimicrobiales bacterium]